MQVQSDKVTTIVYTVQMTEQEYANLLGDIRHVRDAIIGDINGGMKNICPYLFDFCSKLDAFD